ncbi:M1 family metallopeptidase [Pelagerythrobacter aerophilus]|uniref:Aminopeptidase N n=1 Tax=Pelagerythrobacter aerophilus TaxID=2306995 RepID=A0A418NG42_9SPHN|nr:M1 family metallopeptidase [Pelagerythrobacter aerophilus]RIV77027.1 M1 family peptidase [Pelagerythrobacter aerophilus]
MRPIAAALSLLLATTACTTMDAQPPAVSAERLVAPILTTPDAVDSSTFAQPQVARVTHVALDLALDFERDRVGGTATLDILARPDASQIVLDSDGLQVSRVTDGRGNELDFDIGERVEGKGAPLTITIGNARHIVIAYTANPQASALQWLDPEQTAGGEYPFLFSQGQAILNRSWIPTQDSPGIRQTWEARVTAPKPLDVVMSGILQGEPEDLGNGRRAFRFVMDKPVAPYLIAIAAGDIDFRAIGPRTGVWAEPAILDRAHWEVADTEDMVKEAEALYGPYRWGRYDMIVLPPAFPFGGMENPVMTFLTPTFIAGDRSLTGLVAHELAHSWSGNLVTNAVWADSWLNEGVTSYFENRIIEEIYGEKRAEQEAALSFAAIEDTLAEVGTDAPGTALHQPDGTDSAGSAIVYDKGAAFLRTLEHEVGRERFDAWLRQWFDNHAFEPATSAMIYEDMRKNLARSEAEAERLRLREWIYEPGLPANVARPDPAAFATVDAAAAAYGGSRAIPAAAAWRKWSSAERQRFLQKLPQELSAEELAQLDRQLGLAATGNNEELFLWLELALANRYEPAVPKAEAFLAEVGRAKFVRPLFATLMEEGEWGRPIAQRIYAKTRPSYHAVTRGSVDKVVGWKE